MSALEILPDVQATQQDFGLAIDQVGIKALRFPVSIATASGAQSTVATLDMYVSLPSDQKGTHMSRFVEHIEAFDGAFDFASFQQFLSEMTTRLHAADGEVCMTFPYFIRKTAPVSGVQSLLDVQASFTGRLSAAQGWQFELEVKAPVTSLCPCSKQISRYGAHNQRSEITLRVALNAAMSIEELVRIAEEKASCEVFGLLKRPDEKWVTERAYDNPKFVEDLVREIALALREDSRIDRFVVESENFESIHNHSAFARVRWQRPSASVAA